PLPAPPPPAPPETTGSTPGPSHGFRARANRLRAHGPESRPRPAAWTRAPPKRETGAAPRRDRSGGTARDSAYPAAPHENCSDTTLAHWPIHGSNSDSHRTLRSDYTWKVPAF